MPPALGRIAFHFSNSNKKHFYRNLTPSNTGQIKLVNFEKRLAKNRRKILKTQCISVYADVLMMYITCLCTVISRSSLKRLAFVIVIDYALILPWLVKKLKKKQLMT